MKKIINLLSIAFLHFSLYSQTAAVGMNEEFKQLSGEVGSHVSTGYEGIQTYKTDKINGNQFFYSSWTKGTVITSANETINNPNYLFLFDKVRQQLLIKDNSSSDILIADPNKLQSFTIYTDQPNAFVNASIYDSSLSGNFFEVLAQNNKYALFKLVNTTFEKADEHDMLKMKNGEFSDEFVDHVSYYVFHNNQLKKVNLQQFSIRKSLKDDNAKVNAYFDAHQNDEIDESFLIGLINDLNS
jgi:hypothetical protein